MILELWSCHVAADWLTEFYGDMRLEMSYWVDDDSDSWMLLKNEQWTMHVYGVNLDIYFS